MRERLFPALGTLEERRELLETCVTKSAERRHRRARVDARGALQVRDLERNALVLRAFGRQVRRAGETAAGAFVGMAVEATRDGEEIRARDRRLVVREALLLGPRRHKRLQLRAERLLRRRTLVREHAHRDDDEDRRD